MSLGHTSGRQELSRANGFSSNMPQIVSLQRQKEPEAPPSDGNPNTWLG